MKEIIFIINSFNRFSLLKECLGVLSKWLPSSLNERCACVIFDAGSTDGSIEWLQSQAASHSLEIHLIIAKQGKDSSFAAGINSASQFAINMYPNLKYLLFYETDNQILSPVPILQALKQLEKKDKLAACGFTVRRHDNSPAGVGMPFPKLTNFALGKNVVHKLQLESIPYHWQQDENGIAFSKLDVVFTSPLLVKKQAWIDSGGLDAAVFPFSECDVDWAKRLSDKGWEMGVIKTSDVIHDNRNELSNWSKTRAINAHRGKLRYFRRHHPYTTFFVWPVFLLIRHTLEYILVKFFVTDKERKKRLLFQSKSLLNSCIKGYQ